MTTGIWAIMWMLFISSFIHLSIMRQETPVCEVPKIDQHIKFGLDTQLNVQKNHNSSVIGIIWDIFGKLHEVKTRLCVYFQTYLEV